MEAARAEDARSQQRVALEQNLHELQAQLQVRLEVAATFGYTHTHSDS